MAEHAGSSNKGKTSLAGNKPTGLKNPAKRSVTGAGTNISSGQHPSNPAMSLSKMVKRQNIAPQFGGEGSGKPAPNVATKPMKLGGKSPTNTPPKAK